MDVRAGLETAHKAQPGQAGEAAAGRKETPMKTQTFGIEIEMNHITRQRAAQVVAETLGEGATFRHTGGAYDAWEVTAPDGRRWKLVSDASIAGPRDQGTEFVSPICRWEDIETVQACVRALRAAGAHADPSCGIHVHVGLGEHTPKTLRNLVNLVNAKEDLLTQALQISPERRSRWCQPVDPDFLATLNRRKPATSEDFARIWYDDRDWAYHAHQHYDPSRYHLLNLHSVFQKGTIEFRAFNSTLHAGEIKAYIQLCLAISHQALTVASASPARPVTDNPAYTFRCWLLRLSMNGEEFKTARTHLLKHQTLLYINEGYTADEIAAMIRLPEALEKVWYTRQYYGTLKHNVKAVYQKYMGWYDANPVHLDELEPAEYAKKLVEYLGDADKVLEMARADYAKGEYQWVAEITNALVFADPANQNARYLCADALEQLGYQAESGAWRNVYLVAAFELRNGTGAYPQTNRIGVGTTAQSMDAQTMLDYMGIMLDAEKLADKSFTVNLKLSDGGDYLLKIHHGVLLYYKDRVDEQADLTLSTTRMGILALANGDSEKIAQFVTLENGDEALLKALCESMAAPELYFNVIEP